MRHAKTFSILIFTIVLGYAALGFYFLPRATFQGELTRMALLPESLFGWTKPQPKLDAQWLQQAIMTEADLLVVGDSFSEGHVWQSVLTQQRMKVRTESWNSMKGICEDFSPWIREQGYTGKYVVIEIVERNLMGTLRQSLNCLQTRYRPLAYVDAPRTPPVEVFEPNEGNYAGKLSTGFKTYLNTARYERLSNESTFQEWELPNNVRIARVKEGCRWFSHARCQDSLFLAEDMAGEVDAEALTLIKTLESRLRGLTPIWVIVPNKSTTYRYPDKRFWQQLAQQTNAPDLLALNRQALDEGMVDLYPANNTHYSTSGYLLMGEAIRKMLVPTPKAH
jgi:hypothetical protein